MRKALLFGSLLVLAVISVLAYNYSNHVTPANLTVTPTPAPWHPISLRIPDLHIDAPVINVGATITGQMDAPTSNAVNSPYWSSVFWYAPGTAPGQAGNAVIAGHVNRVGGDPAIFWSLNALKRGNPVFVQTAAKTTLKFVVDRVVQYPADAPKQEVIDAVFGPTKTYHLNLITCSGAWTNQGFDQRLVVFTTLANT